MSTTTLETNPECAILVVEDQEVNDLLAASRSYDRQRQVGQALVIQLACMLPLVLVLLWVHSDPIHILRGVLLSQLISAAMQAWIASRCRHRYRTLRESWLKISSERGWTPASKP